MTAPIRELPRTEIPRSLVLVAATACGVLAAIAAQIALAQRGIELTSIWRDLLSARGRQISAAGAWWMIAGSGLIVGAMVAAALSRFPLPWLRFRLMRWIIGAAIVATMAHVGHSAAAQAGVAISIHFVATFAAIVAAALAALFGAYFAAKR